MRSACLSYRTGIVLGSEQSHKPTMGALLLLLLHDVALPPDMYGPIGRVGVYPQPLALLEWGYIGDVLQHLLRHYHTRISITTIWPHVATTAATAAASAACAATATQMSQLEQWIRSICRVWSPRRIRCALYCACGVLSTGACGLQMVRVHPFRAYGAWRRQVANGQFQRAAY